MVVNLIDRAARRCDAFIRAIGRFRLIFVYSRDFPRAESCLRWTRLVVHGSSASRKRRAGNYAELIGGVYTFGRRNGQVRAFNN